MDRRSFLTRSGLTLGALIVGDEVLEAMDRLTHRKMFALGAIPRRRPESALYVRESPLSPWVLLDRAPVNEDGISTFNTVIPIQYTEAQIATYVPEFTPSFNHSAFAYLA
jgi:hypothetical protein